MGNFKWHICIHQRWMLVGSLKSKEKQTDEATKSVHAEDLVNVILDFSKKPKKNR